ncbi:MAG: SCP2 sterol-binding domain-containing protein [Oligoflexia bacterium]|nr:SCP2 sterol-binding domain-containing protein [Oligoflexia bacterium]
MQTERTGTGSPLMAQDPRLFFEETLGSRLLRRVGDALPEDVVVGFQITGPGGGDWQVSTVAGRTRLEPLQAGPRDCTVRCPADVFMDIVRGNLDARDAFLDGRLRLLGDIGLALRLQSVLPSAA